MFALAEHCFSEEECSKAGARTTKVVANIFVKKRKKKCMATSRCMLINRGCNQPIPTVTFWKVDLLAIAKWLLSPSFCMPSDWALYLLPLSKNEQWLIIGRRKRK